MLSTQGVNLLIYKVTHTSFFSIEKVIVLHLIALVPYFRCPNKKSSGSPSCRPFFGDHRMTGRNLWTTRNQGWSPEPTFEAKAKDSKETEAKTKERLFEDRRSQGHRQKYSRPRPTKDQRHNAKAFYKKKCFRARNRKFFAENSRTCRLRGQTLDLRGQDRLLQNLSSMS